jgi:hypothetical protein
LGYFTYFVVYIQQQIFSFHMVNVCEYSI